MRSVLRAVTAAAVLLPLMSFVGARQRTVDDFFKEFTDEWVRHNPNLAVSSRYFAGEQQDRLERQLTPLTVEYRKATVQRARTGLAELRKFDRASMSDSRRLSGEVLNWQLQSIVEREPYIDYAFPLEQFQGANVGLVSRLTILHPLNSERDAENYVAALGQVSARMDEAAAEARRRAGKGILPPRFILHATIAQMRSFIDPPAGQNPYVVNLTQKIAALPAISATQRVQLREEAEAIVSKQVYPAWKRAIELLQSQLPRSTDDAGLWRLKGGAGAYTNALRNFTTTDLTPDQIHETGLKRVKEIEAEMDALLRRLGRTGGSVKDRLEKLREDLRYPDPASEPSRERIMQDIESIMRDAEKRAPLLFDKTPRSPVVAKPTQRYQEANDAARYMPPAADGSRPAIFQYPRSVENMTRFRLRSTVYHETVPGHHFQIALQAENTDLPAFRQRNLFGVISAFVEGWALYAERLAAESDWYADDLEGRLGQLDAELFRARRLVVDTGIHAKRWTRRQAIDYGIEASEVERYVVFPGQACSYMIGQLKLLELRDKARKALGDGFSLRQFHNIVLETGAVPLDILERRIDAWIKASRNK
jgi:uncharacterized protein (DUF885 family)